MKILAIETTGKIHSVKDGISPLNKKLFIISVKATGFIKKMMINIITEKIETIAFTELTFLSPKRIVKCILPLPFQKK